MSDQEQPALWERMRALADKGHIRADEIYAKADEFEHKAVGFYSDPQTVDVKSFLGAFARARKLWCELTGEPLV
jgi:hypothetical protein